QRGTRRPTDGTRRLPAERTGGVGRAAGGAAGRRLRDANALEAIAAVAGRQRERRGASRGTECDAMRAPVHAGPPATRGAARRVSPAEVPTDSSSPGRARP